MYVCMHVCMYIIVCMDGWIDAGCVMYLCMCVYIIYVHACMYVRIHIHVHTILDRIMSDHVMTYHTMPHNFIPYQLMTSHIIPDQSRSGQNIFRSGHIVFTHTNTEYCMHCPFYVLVPEVINLEARI